MRYVLLLFAVVLCVSEAQAQYWLPQYSYPQTYAQRNRAMFEQRQRAMDAEAQQQAQERWDAAHPDLAAQRQLMLIQQNQMRVMQQQMMWNSYFPQRQPDWRFTPDGNGGYRARQY